MINYNRLGYEIKRDLANLEFDDIFLKMWYDYSALAIRENVHSIYRRWIRCI